MEEKTPDLDETASLREKERNALEEEEVMVLSKRRVAFFFFFTGLVVLALLFLIRMDLDINLGLAGQERLIVNSTTPLLLATVHKAVTACKGGMVPHGVNLKWVRDAQRDPRMLMAVLFGSLYSRTDYLMPTCE
uniref:Wsv136-like protein n=1 Tax=Sicyonia whispovirus TaxID=2984283 RepID=A0A9C7C9F8_9VIRU|nr:MAG: wsv136-like protein [Sicyonia whispovirus]